ncbi:MAG: diguanylate cyclase [Saccharofermentans sp.]|nr:diguanylate cyclase [Saccharofermentans sp.]
MNTDSTLILFFISISIAMALLDVIVACHAFAERKKFSTVLGVACLGSSIMQILYLGSVFSHSYYHMSLLSTLYFISKDFAVLCMLTFIRAYSIKKPTKLNTFFKHFVSAFFIFDVVVFLTNAFYKEIAVHYAYIGGVIARFTIIVKPLYYVHLAYNYFMVVVIVYHLVKRAATVPKEYRRQYQATVFCIAVVIFLNALVIFQPTIFGKDALDYSIWGFSIAVFAIYSNFFRYPATAMKSYYHEWIVENVNQGVVLFNFEDELIIHNDKFHSIFSECQIKDGMKVEDFIQELNLGIKANRNDEDYSFQVYVSRKDKEFPVRFDHRCLLNNNGKRIGQLFVFTDEAGDVDLLTSFISWEKFKQVIVDEPESFAPPVVVAVCDINGLGEINNRFGNSVGDQAIETLANVMRKHFVGESYFVRGQEASLIALCFDLTESEVKEKLNDIYIELINYSDLGCIINIQSAIGIVDYRNSDVLDVVKQAFQGLKNKKLLDVKSRRSELVTSLVKTLAECDNDTEAHVRRTQVMGAELGNRLGLSDVQQSDLALLCILHDIGKIGIPLEILNKPAKLSDSEWRMMKTHTEKGYQIATSSQELSHIADMILHHHECWDGRGYPDGLSKESIPLLSRIIAVVDSYDAMVNDRAYRPAMPVEDAIKELKRCAGTQFDPSIVNEFVHMLPEIVDMNIEDNLDLLNNAESEDKDNEEVETTYKLSTHVHDVRYSRYVLAEDMRIIHIDDEFEHLTGYTKEDLEKDSITQTDLLPEEDRTEYIRLVSEQLSRKNLAYFEHRLKRKDGSIIYVFCYGKIYYDSAEMAERSEIIVFDSSSTHAMQLMVNEEKSKAEVRLAKWEDKYRCDSLTGLLNHEAFKNDIEQRLLENETKVMLLMMDVDKFKGYNDTYGHRAGDEFLIMVSQSLTETLRKDDLACRMGGDEFAAALFYGNNTSDDVMLERAQQICDKINFVLTNQKGGTSLSMGAVVSSNELKSFNKLYENADEALYKAKESGRAKMVVYKK